MIGKYCTPLMSTLRHFFLRGLHFLSSTLNLCKTASPTPETILYRLSFKNFHPWYFSQHLTPIHMVNKLLQNIFEIYHPKHFWTQVQLPGGGIPLVLHGLSTSKAKVLVLLFFLIEGPTALQPLSPPLLLPFLFDDLWSQGDGRKKRVTPYKVSIFCFFLRILMIVI